MPDGLEYPYIFPPLVKHNDFASRVRGSGKVISAGFVSINEDPDNVNCWGESFSLQITSRKQDKEVMETMFCLI